MPKKPFVDFRAVKAAITMEKVLDHYGLLSKFKRGGDTLSGCCPIHKGSNPTQFRVSISKNVWNCFSECKHGGNSLDFIARMEVVSIHDAALKAMEWFSLDPEQMSAPSPSGDAEEQADKDSPSSPPKTAERKKAVVAETTGMPNKPLGFRLDKLRKDHPYLAERGLSPETVAEFGVGFCEKGSMAERIAIPVCNPEGKVVAYAGRLIGEPSGDAPKYKLPQGFRKSLELFNAVRAMKEPKDEPLIIVEGFFDCMRLHQHGCRKVVALMGSTMSGAQEELIFRMTEPNSRVIVMLDEDDAGKAGREDVAVRLSKRMFVKVYAFGTEGFQPENLTAEDVQELLG